MICIILVITFLRLSAGKSIIRYITKCNSKAFTGQTVLEIIHSEDTTVLGMLMEWKTEEYPRLKRQEEMTTRHLEKHGGRSLIREATCEKVTGRIESMAVTGNSRCKPDKGSSQPYSHPLKRRTSRMESYLLINEQ